MTKASAAVKVSENDESGPNALSLVQSDELADVIGDVELGVDGLEETDASDRKVAALVFNFAGVDNAGDPIPKNRFFDTVSEEVKPRVRLALLTVHKSNAWTEFSDAQGTVVRCRSWDRIHGETEAGEVRPCKGCPDKQWQRDRNTGKRTRRCADVANVVGIDLDDAQPKVLRFKKTSSKPWKAYLNKHFLGKRIVNGTRANLPLFAVETEVSLEMVKGNSGSYATPVFERARTFSRDEILYFAEQCKAAREWMDDVKNVAESAEAKESVEIVDASFDASEFTDEAPASAAHSNGNGAARF